MAINAIKFAEKLVYIDNLSVEHEGLSEYTSQSEWKFNISEVIPFSCELTTSWDEITLFTYADGTRLIFEYTLEKNEFETLFTLNSRFKLVEKNGDLVDLSDINWENPTYTIRTTQSWDPSFETYPFSEMYYIISQVNYRSGTEETVVGDPARSISVWGKIYVKRVSEPVGGYIELQGVHTEAEINNSYLGISPPGIITTETVYNDYFGIVDPEDEWHKGGSVPTPPDPSGPGGGDRPSDDGGEAIDFPGLPTTSVINTGLITLFNPDNTQLRNLAGVLWGNDFEQSIKKVLNDPFDGLIGLSMVPFTPGTGGSISCEIGNFDTEILMPLVNAQFYTLDCGSLKVNENWKNALDYNATTCEIFVPFVGFRPLDIQDVMNKTLSLKYNVDILTGSAIAILKCGDKCLYEWPCNLSYDIPLTGSNRAALYTGLINVAMSGLGGLAAGGAMGAVGGAATSAINVATHAQSQVQRSGSLASNTGVLGEFLPYIVLHRPKQSLAQNFKTFKGYQSNITSLLGSCRGYTEVEYVHLTGIDGATDTELSEIESLLKSGVII